MNFKDKISGIVLCGGLSRRMGSDKSQKKIGDLKLMIDEPFNTKSMMYT